MEALFAPKQLEFVLNSTAKWNFAHGSVRSGKTNGTLFAFMHAVNKCPDDNIWMAGKSATTIYNNAISLLFTAPQFKIFKPFCTWESGKRILHFKDKKIKTIGIKDKGAGAYVQGGTWSLFYGDEMTLYPIEVIEQINARLSPPWSQAYGSMNPTYPTHVIKKWIDAGINGDKNYYSLHFTLDDNPYVDKDYKERIAKSTGVFYKRNYLGLWCLAEGAIFDFFDRDFHARRKPPKAAEYFIAGVDVGTSNAFACLVLGVSTGKYDQSGPIMWVEDEYFWDSKKTGRAKTNLEYANDIESFLEPYGVKQLYIDPSAAAMKEELRRKNFYPIDANNDVYNGITKMVADMHDGSLFVMEKCTNTIREIESYVWDPKASERGEDEPLKIDDHCFTGDTNICTEKGMVRISNLKLGDRVFTTQGFKKIIGCHALEAEVRKYQIHGKRIRCTPNHKILTVNRGWVEASSLTLSDMLCTISGVWNKKLASNLMEKDIEDIQILKDIPTEIISNAEAEFCIEPYMKRLSGKYRRDIIYITKTGTALTTIFPIWSLYLENNISKFIRKIFIRIIFQNMRRKALLSGINLKRVEDGIESMLKNPDSEILIKQFFNAICVKDLLSLESALTSNFVQINVGLNGEETINLIMKKECVSRAVENLIHPNSQKLKTAQSPVLSWGAGKEEVYDLTVEGAHEYFAEGILVHNCMDALRYAVYTHKPLYYDEMKAVERQKDYLQGRFGPRNF